MNEILLQNGGNKLAQKIRKTAIEYGGVEIEDKSKDDKKEKKNK